MYLLFDIGGTQMRFGFSPDGEKLSEPEIVPSPGSFAEALEVVKKVANRLCQDQKIKAVAGGLAGTFNQDNTVLLSAPHLREWINQPVASLLQKEFDCPIYLENDTAMVGLGEAVAGAGAGAGIVAYLTVSTGVGGARIVDGRVDRHTTSFEPGHQIIDYRAPEKHLEDYVSGSAVRQTTQKEPKDITDEDFWREVSRTLAVGLHNTILHWTPEVVVLGGGMMKSPGIILEEVEATLARSLAFLPLRPALRRATLGETGGLHGALSYLKQELAK
jgi:predicted NBD/HSP70 family sugar kinase